MKPLKIILVVLIFFVFAGVLFSVIKSRQANISNKEERKTDAKKSASAQCSEKSVCKNCNVILLSVDSLRADHIGAYGYKRDTTPNFDKLTGSGALFLNYSSASFLTPVSEMSVHTGLYPSSHGVDNFDAVLLDDIETLAQFMKEQEYETSAILSSPEPELNPTLKESFSRGFGQYKYIGDSSIDKEENVRMYPPVSDLLFSGKFFQWIAVGGVYWPYGQSWVRDIYSNKDYNGVFKQYRDDNNGLNWEIFKNIYNGVLYPQMKKVSEEDNQYVIDQYDNGVRAFDDFLGELIDNLNSKDLISNTIIIIQSEHGEALNENGYIAHYDVLDNQTHVPLLILSPCLKRGAKILSMAGSVDIFPTIIEMIGGTSPVRVQGKSLLPIINGKEADESRQEVFIERNPLWEETIAGGVYVGEILKEKGIEIGDERHKDIAIRTPKWKYIWRMSKKQMEKISWWQITTGKKIEIPEAELYDLQNDPLETKNVIDQYPVEAAELRKKLEEWHKKIMASSPSDVKRDGPMMPYF